MKRYIIALAAVAFSASLFLTTGCEIKISGLKPEQEQTEDESMGKSDGKGKFDMSDEVPPAPGDEQFISQNQGKFDSDQKQDQNQDQKQTQKQSQKQDQKQGKY